MNRVLVTKMKRVEFLDRVMPHIDLKLIVDEVQFGWKECRSQSLAIRSLNIDTSEIKSLVKE